MHWLTNDTRDERFIDNIFAELCVRLQRGSIPVKRASLHVLIYHPQWLGARIMWADGMRGPSGSLVVRLQHYPKRLAPERSRSPKTPESAAKSL